MLDGFGLMYKLGLIGLIGMGKLIMFELFKVLGCFIWDVDVVVYCLYFKGGFVVFVI